MHFNCPSNMKVCSVVSKFSTKSHLQSLQTGALQKMELKIPTQGAFAEYPSREDLYACSIFYSVCLVQEVMALGRGLGGGRLVPVVV